MKKQSNRYFGNQPIHPPQYRIESTDIQVDREKTKRRRKIEEMEEMKRIEAEHSLEGIEI